VDAGLVLGSTSEVVEVTGTAPVLQTESGSIGQVVDNHKIVGLPLNGPRRVRVDWLGSWSSRRNRGCHVGRFGSHQRRAQQAQ
jgi:hypothetical protein